MAKYKRWQIGALLVLLVLAVMAIAAMVAGPPLISRTFESALNKAGFAEADVSGVSIGYGPVVRIRRVSLAPGEDFELTGLVAHLSLEGLMTGRVDRLDIAYLDLTMALPSADALALPGYVPPIASSDEPLPVGSLHLKTADIEIGTAEGPTKGLIRIHVQNALLSGDMLEGSMALDHPLLAFAGHLDGQLTPAGTPVHLNLQVSDGYAGPDDYRLQDLAGAVIFDLASNRIDASLTAGNETKEGQNLRFDMKGDLAMKTADIAVAGFLADLAILSPSLAGNAHMALAAFVEWSDELAITSDLDLDINAASLAGRVSDATVSLNARLYGDIKGVVVYADTPWTARFTLADENLSAMLPAYGGKPMTASISARTKGGPLIDYDLETGAMGVDGRLVANAGAGELTGEGVLSLRNQDEALIITGEGLVVTMTGLDLGMAQIADAGLKGQLRWDGTNGVFEGSSYVSGSGTYEDVSLDRVTLDMPALHLSYGNEVAGVAHDGCMTLSVALVQSEDVGLSGLDGLCLMAGRDGIISREGERADLSIALQEGPMALVVQMKGQDDIVLMGQWPQARLDGTLVNESFANASLKLDGGTISAPQQAVNLSGLMMQADFSDKGLVGATARIDEIASTDKPALIAPLSLEVTVEPDGAGHGFEAFLSDLLGIMVIEGKGTFSPDGGKADITLYPINFIPDAVEPGDLSPALQGLLSGLTGMLSFESQVTWSETGKNSTALLSLTNLTGRAGSAIFSGINGDIQFDSLWPLSTPAGQKLSIDGINIGAPLLDGSVVFGLSDNTLLAVETVRFDLAGGSINADPFIVDLSSPANAGFVLQASDVDLAQIFEVGGVDGLTGEGRLDGRIPLVFSKDGLQIDDGLLVADGVGVLRYIPHEMPAFMKGDDMRSQMLRQALQNFQYEALSLSVSGRLGETQKLALSASGANPDFLDGHPIELNVNISGDLVDAVESAIGAFGLERMFKDKQQEKKDGKNGEIKP